MVGSSLHCEQNYYGLILDQKKDLEGNWWAHEVFVKCALNQQSYFEKMCKQKIGKVCGIKVPEPEVDPDQAEGDGQPVAVKGEPTPEDPELEKPAPKFPSPVSACDHPGSNSYIL